VAIQFRGIEAFPPHSPGDGGSARLACGGEIDDDGEDELNAFLVRGFLALTLGDTFGPVDSFASVGRRGTIFFRSP
jgi:hypothetical protein